MRVSAKLDYALRALAELAVLEAAGSDTVTREQMASEQEIPVAFLENILLELKRGGIVQSVRGQKGGFRLARPAREITLAQVIRAVDGPLASVRGVRPEALDYHGSARALQEVWVAVRAGLREVLERVTLADLAAGSLPAPVARRIKTEDAWLAH
jgi:Rrf2 family protein